MIELVERDSREVDARGPPRSRGAALVDAIGQQLVWWTTVLSVRIGEEAVAVAAATALVLAHVLARRRPRLFLLAVFAAMIGFAVDTALVRAGLLFFPGHPSASVTRPWMVGLWMVFGVAFDASLTWLRDRPWWTAALIGAVAGVLAMRAGDGLGILRIEKTTIGYGAVAIAWAGNVALLGAAARTMTSVRWEVTR